MGGLKKNQQKEERGKYAQKNRAKVSGGGGGGGDYGWEWELRRKGGWGAPHLDP